MCGVLYGLKSATDRDTIISFAYDLYKFKIIYCIYNLFLKNYDSMIFLCKITRNYFYWLLINYQLITNIWKLSKYKIYNIFFFSTNIIHFKKKFRNLGTKKLTSMLIGIIPIKVWQCLITIPSMVVYISLIRNVF